MGVLTQPGSTAFTRMPCVPRSRPSAFASMLMAPLVPQYAVWPGAPTCAEIELTQQIAPPCPSRIICLALSVQTTQVPRTFVSNRLSKSPTVVSSHVMSGLIAALDTTQSSRPPRSATVRTIVVTCPGSRMSATTGNAFPPTSAIRWSVCDGSPAGRWFTATVAPSAARRTAVACPIPAVAPVTSATLPSKRRSMRAPISEDGDRVPGRSRPAGQPERQADDHELEAPLLFACPRHVLQLQAVGGEHAHGRDLKRVDRVQDALDVARDRLPVAVRQECSDPALVHPADGVDVQARLALAGRRVAVVPRAKLEPAPVMAGAEDEDVPLAEPRPLSLLDRLELRTGHRLTRLEPLDPAEPRHIQQHSPADQALAVGRHVERGGALGGHHLVGRPAVVDAALIGDVAQRVHVGVAVAVEGEPDEVRCERHPGRADVNVVALDHVADDGARVVRPRGRVHRDRHRRAPPGTDQRGRRPHSVRRDVVERPEFVVGAPAAPVLDRLEDLIELLQAYRRGLRQGRHRLLTAFWSLGLLRVRRPAPRRPAVTPGLRTRGWLSSPATRRSQARTCVPHQAPAIAARPAPGHPGGPHPGWCSAPWQLRTCPRPSSATPCGTA